MSISKEEKSLYCWISFRAVLTCLLSLVLALSHSNINGPEGKDVQIVSGLLPQNTTDAVLSWYHFNCVIFWSFGVFASVTVLLSAMCKSQQFGLYFYWLLIGQLWEVLLICNLILTLDRPQAYWGILMRICWICCSNYISFPLLAMVMGLYGQEDEKQVSVENYNVNNNNKKIYSIHDTTIGITGATTSNNNNIETNKFQIVAIAEV